MARALRSRVHSHHPRREHAGTPAAAAQQRSWLPALLLLAAAFFTGPALAAVDLRVEAAPVTDPIQAFVTVTNASGNPVSGLDASAFTMTIDGVAIPIQPSDLTLPPNQNPDQKVSVIFVMDYSTSVQTAALPAMQAAITDFINAMNDGDVAAIVKFSSQGGATLVQPFTEINDAAKTQLISVVMTDYLGGQTNLLDALDLALDQFITLAASLPEGPKAVIVVTDGRENASGIVEGVVHDKARDNSIPIFSIGVTTNINTNLLTRLAVQSGGAYLPAPTDAEIAAAYVTISELLNNDYLLTIDSSITDCNSHTMQVTVTGQGSASYVFARCGVAPPPDPPPPPPPPSDNGGGGGGGAVHLMSLLAGLVVLGARRRRLR